MLNILNTKFIIIFFTIEDLKVIFVRNFYCSDLFIDGNFWLDILPELALILFICYSLVSICNDSIASIKHYYRWIFFLIIVLLCLIEQFLILKGNLHNIIFGYAWVNCYYIWFTKVLLIILTLIVLLISESKIKVGKMLVCANEFPLIIGFSIFFMFLVTSSYDFFGMYLAIEGLSLTLYTLAALLYQGVVAVEAAIKYFSLGAFSTGILLFGISTLFNLIGSLDFLEVQYYLRSEELFDNFEEVKFSLICILFGFFFKFAAFPCHVWVADVYEGIWTPVTAFFGIVVKAVMFLFFLRLIFNVLINSMFIFQQVFIFITVGSMLIGSLNVLKETRLKRIIAYTSINQIGFLFLGIASCSFSGFISSLLYFFIYLIMTIVFFTLLLNMEHVKTKRSLLYLSDLYFTPQFSTEASKHLTLTILSMAGLPPLAGFIGKFFLYFSAIEARLDMTIFFSMLLGMISTYYYLNLVRHIWFETTVKRSFFVFKVETGYFIEILLKCLSGILVGFIVIVPSILSFITSIALSCTYPLIYG